MDLLESPYSLDDYRALDAALLRGDEQDLSRLEDRARPGALVSYQGELFQVVRSFVGTEDAWAKALRVRRVAEPAGEGSVGRDILLLARGLALCRLVKPAPSVPDFGPELS